MRARTPDQRSSRRTARLPGRPRPHHRSVRVVDRVAVVRPGPQDTEPTRRVGRHPSVAQAGAAAAAAGAHRDRAQRQDVGRRPWPARCRRAAGSGACFRSARRPAAGGTGSETGAVAGGARRHRERGALRSRASLRGPGPSASAAPAELAASRRCRRRAPPRRALAGVQRLGRGRRSRPPRRRHLGRRPRPAQRGERDGRPTANLRYSGHLLRTKPDRCVRQLSAALVRGGWTG
jgi:hypothetical protein